LRAEFPAEFWALFSARHKKIKALYEQLQVSSIAQLQAACDADQVANLPSFGKTTQTKLCQAIAGRAKHAGIFSSVRSRVKRKRCKTICARIRLSHVCIAGSYRRRKEIKATLSHRGDENAG
jgi:DNA polymerase (family 10)